MGANFFLIIAYFFLALWGGPYMTPLIYTNSDDGLSDSVINRTASILNALVYVLYGFLLSVIGYSLSDIVAYLKCPLN
jgi:hypothetical protein